MADDLNRLDTSGKGVRAVGVRSNKIVPRYVVVLLPPESSVDSISEVPEEYFDPIACSIDHARQTSMVAQNVYDT